MSPSRWGDVLRWVTVVLLEPNPGARRSRPVTLALAVYWLGAALAVLGAYVAVGMLDEPPATSDHRLEIALVLAWFAATAVVVLVRGARLAAAWVAFGVQVVLLVGGVHEANGDLFGVELSPGVIVVPAVTTFIGAI